MAEPISITSTPVDPDDRSFTISEFCMAERMSLPSYYKMKGLGVGPAELVIPGTKMIRITADARRAWHKRMDELNQSKAAKLERERRRAQTVEAGRIAAASPRHHSKRKA